MTIVSIGWCTGRTNVWIWIAWTAGRWVDVMMTATSAEEIHCRSILEVEDEKRVCSCLIGRKTERLRRNQFGLGEEGNEKMVQVEVVMEGRRLPIFLFRFVNS